MREHPVLFNDAMVRAILAGTKTQTRRPIKASRGRELCMLTDHEGRLYTDDAGRPRVDECWCREPEIVYDVRRPAEVGDVLWVREAYHGAYFDDGTCAYRADWTGKAADLVSEPKWTPSIHMPRRASRLSLRVTEVRVERVQDITESDACAEGYNWQGYAETCDFADHARPWFRDLWNNVYGAWDANPWVWAVTFEVVR